MHYLAMHPKRQFTPMVVFSNDARKLVNDLLDTSEECKTATRDFTLEKVELLTLDPGGFLNMNEPYVPFEVEGHKFEIQLSKIGDVLWLTDDKARDRERLPGVIRFRNFGQNVLMPKELTYKLREKLSELSKTDAALHAQITDAEIKAKIEKVSEGTVIFPSIPREPSRGV
jgi:hypothetical protein